MRVVLGYSGLATSQGFKRRALPGLSEREYAIAQGADAAAAIIVDGKVVAAAAEERFTREKHTGAFPVNAMHYCLSNANLNITDVNAIAHSFDYDTNDSPFRHGEFYARQHSEVFAPAIQVDFFETY